MPTELPVDGCKPAVALGDIHCDGDGGSIELIGKEAVANGEGLRGRCDLIITIYALLRRTNFSKLIANFHRQ